MAQEKNKPAKKPSTSSSAKPTKATPAKKTPVKKATNAKPAPVKKSVKKDTKPQKTKEPTLRNSTLKSEIVGFILVFLSIFLLICITNKDSGMLGNFVDVVMKFLFGTTGQIVISVILLIIGICLITKLKIVTQYRGNTFFIIAVINFLIAVALFENANLNDFLFVNNTLHKIVTHTSAAGVIAQVLTNIFVSLISITGTWLLIILTTIISFIIIFRKSVSSAVSTQAVKIKDTIAVKQEEHHIKKEERKQENEAELFILGDKSKKNKEAQTDDAALFLMRKNYKEQVETQAHPKDDLDELDVSLGIIINDDIHEEEVVETEKAEKKPFNDLFGSFSKDKEKEEHDEKSSILLDIDNLDNDHISADNNEFFLDFDPQKIVKEDEKADQPKVEYDFPTLNLLDHTKVRANKAGRQEVLANATHLEKTLSDFSIAAKVTQISVGPTITRYELQLHPGIRVSKVVSLSDDIAMALAAQRVRIEAPIPGKSAIGIEVPNKEVDIVRLSEILSSSEFTSHPSPLAIALGKKLAGDMLVMDITKMPHLLIAGATGSGKSVCINAIIMSILYHSSPDDVKLILVDPKMVELNVYNDVPHLLIPVVTEPKNASGALNWAVREMTMRYECFSQNKVKDITGYNKKMLSEGGEKYPHIVLIIDELSDLMMAAAQQVESSICRLAQLARAAGIHLILATQRPSVNVITGLIKANIPSRISFAVSSQTDSRTILDMGGAEKLLGRGDMLYYPMGMSKPIRAQCAFVSEEEVEKVVEFVKDKSVADYDEDVIEEIAEFKDGKNEKEKAESSDFEDELVIKAMELAFEKGQISTSTVQRRLRLGYARAGRIIDEMEERGYISPADGSKPRTVLIGSEEFYRRCRQ